MAEQQGSAVDRVRAACSAFAEALAAIDGTACGGRQVGEYGREVEELRKRDVAQLMEQIDSVRAWATDLLVPMQEQVEQFLGTEASYEFEDALGLLGQAGGVVFDLVRKLDPATADGALNR